MGLQQSHSQDRASQAIRNSPSKAKLKLNETGEEKQSRLSHMPMPIEEEDSDQGVTLRKSQKEVAKQPVKKHDYEMRRLRDQQRLIDDDEDILKIDKLQLINASARHELLSANQQLLDFQLNRFVSKHHRQKTLRKALTKQDPEEVPFRIN